MRHLALALMLGLGACAGTSQGPSAWVSPEITAADRPALAQAVAGFATMRGGFSNGPIALTASDDPMAQEVERALRNAGFAVGASGRPLSYQVDTRPGGALVRVTLDDVRGARAYARTESGALAAAGPYTVTLTEAPK